MRLLSTASCRLDVLTSAPGLIGTVVPESMQPRDGTIKNNNDVKDKSKNQTKRSSKSQKKKGDRLQIAFFGDHGLTEGADRKIQYLTSILSFQRQFHACAYDRTNTIFDGELLGNKVVFDTLTDGNDDTLDSSVTESDNSMVRMRDISGSIRIPPLNESQQQACDSFLSDHGVKVSIVQG